MLKRSTLPWFAAAIMAVFSYSGTFAQCGTSTFNEGGVAVGCGAFGASSNISSTAYRTFTVVNGVNYSISTCGSAWDSQVTVRDNSDGYKVYNDDNGPSCTGNAASVDWTADYSGTARAYVHRYNCGNTWPGSSAVLQIRQNSTVSNTTNTGSICTYQTKALTYSVSSGTGVPTWTVVSGGGSISGTTYTPAAVTVNTTVTVRATLGVCSSDASFVVTPPPSTPAPGTAGNGTWNIYAYAAGDAAGGSGAWTTNYSGYYTDNTLSFNTGTRWPNSPSEANATGGNAYVGCAIPPDNHSWRAIRTNISCGTYQLQVTHDDVGQIFINGVNVYNNATCCVSTNAGTFVITPSDVIEYRVSEGGGGSNGLITFNNAATTLDAGAITYGGSTAACGSYDPPAFGSSTGASGGASASVTNIYGQGVGTSTYQWQVNGGDIGGATGLTYDAPNITTPGTYTYRRRVTDKCGAVAYSNTFTITVTANPGAASNTTSTAAICETTTKPLIGTPAGGSWSVVTGGGTIAGTTYTPANVTSATSVTVRYTIAAVGACPATTSDVTFTVDADPGTASNTTSNAAICESSTKALTGSPAGGTWSVISGGGSIAGTTYTPANVTTATSVTVRYTIAGSGTCPGSTSDVTFTVNANDISNTTSAAAICESSTKALTGTPAGGTWSVVSGGGTIAGTTYTPANVTSATSVTVRYTVSGGACGTLTSDVTFTVDANDISNTTSTAAICETSTKALTGTPAGGSWSVVSGGGTIAGTTYTPANVTSATSVTVRYTVSGGACGTLTSDATFTVDADPGTASNTTSNAAICESSTKALTGSPAGGTWSVISGGGSIAGTTYTPANVTSATSVTVRYSIAGSGTCAGSTSDVTFTVNANDISNTTSAAAICETSTKALTGTPAGGTWSVVSGGGSIAGTTYTPANVTSATSVTVRYTVSGGACGTLTSDVTFTVDANDISNTTSTAAICETSTKALTGTPAGGTWSVVSGGGTIAGTTYTPANVTSATSVTVRYTVSGGACGTLTSDATFTVDADPGTASNTTSNAAICESSTKALTGSPAGGTWSVISGGGSIAGTTYTPANVTSATSVTVRYSIAGSGTCPGSTSDVTFTVNANDISNTTSTAAICESSTKALTGTPAGGTWSVVSGGGTIAGTTYTPANVTSATSVTVRYTVSGGACGTLTSDVTFTVDANDISNTTSTAAICETSTKPLIGTPAGGTWSVVSGGGSIAGTTYTPANVTSATSVTVRYTVSGGACGTLTSDATFTVDAAPGTASNTTSNAAICETSTKALTGTPAGGTWSVISGGGSIAGTTYTPANVTSATSVTVRYTIAGSGTCPGSTSDVTFTVDADPGTASNTTSNAAICESSTKALTGTPAGGTWSVISGGGSIAGTTYTPANVTSATSVTVRYTIAASGNCPGSSSDVTFTVDADPGTASNTTSNADICESATKALTGTPAGGSWSVVSGGGTIAGTTYTPDDVSSATSVTVRYSIAGSGTCPGSTSDVTFAVNPTPAAFAPTVVTTLPLCFGGNARIDISGPETGVSYQLRDNTTNVHTPASGPGTVTLHTDNLTAASSTYNVLATSGVGSCTLSVSVPAISVSATPTALANNNDARTCYINGNNAYVEFFSANGSIIAINPGAQNLGDVTVTEYVEGVLGIQACGTSPSTQPQFNTATLGRHWTISSTVAPSSNLNVRLYFADVDVASLSVASLTNVNGFDDLNNIGELELNKYSGANENGTFTDNCGNGTVTQHPQVGNGAMSSGNIGYTVPFASYSVHTVSSFSEFWLDGSGNVTPLPIVLTSFDATCSDGSVVLAWETASEINNEDFLLERSDNMQVWDEVAVVPGAGNSNQPLHYQTVDERPLQGLSYYRLTQRDYDGKSETFAPVSITCYSDGKGNSMMVYPNPAGDVFNVAVTSAQTAQGDLVLTDANGKTVFMQHVNLVAGSNTFTVNTDMLNPGTYVVNLRTGSLGLKPVKVIIVK